MEDEDGLHQGVGRLLDRQGESGAGMERAGLAHLLDQAVFGPAVCIVALLLDRDHPVGGGEELLHLLAARAGARILRRGECTDELSGGGDREGGHLLQAGEALRISGGVREQGRVEAALLEVVERVVLGRDQAREELDLLDPARKRPNIGDDQVCLPLPALGPDRVPRHAVDSPTRTAWRSPRSGARARRRSAGSRGPWPAPGGRPVRS